MRFERSRSMIRSMVCARDAAAGVVVGLGLIGLMGPAASAQSFTGLGFLPGGWTSSGNAISANGLVIVGNSVDAFSATHAFRWTRARGMQEFDALPGGTAAEAFGVSGDGSVAVGYSAPFEGAHACRWTSGAVDDLGELSIAFAVSGDGSVVVGEAYSSGDVRAFRWTVGEGIVDLGTLTDGTYAASRAVSVDGSVVVGVSATTGGEHAFRWTSAGGMQDLGVLPGGMDSVANGVSGDGSVVVGSSSDESGDEHAFVWTSAGGMRDLGVLPGGTFSIANCISGDASVVVGFGTTSGSSHAILWDSDRGLLNLNTYLPSLGIDLTGWTLESANGVSADGLTFTGTGLHNGSYEAWIVSLTKCPADFNHDFLVNSQDFFDFLVPFFAGAVAADFNADGVVNSVDVFDYLTAFFAACT